MLLNYIVSKGFHLEDYKVLTTFPRKDVRNYPTFQMPLLVTLIVKAMIYFSYPPFVLQLTTLDSTKTLDELKLCPQETVILEERHEDSD